jgi:branched-chain amino acid transport system ATP-binding protein
MAAEGLVVDDLSVGYAGVLAVRNVSFSVAPGEVLAVLGSNGAGKTTLLLAIAGLLAPASGEVRVGGEDIGGRAPHQISKLGVCLVPDDRGLCFELNVGEHFRLAASSTRGRRTRQQRTADRTGALRLFPKLSQLFDREVALLSGGEQQMLALGRALVMSPRVLLVDEASLGLAPQLVQELLPAIRSYAVENGAGVVIVEQHYEAALRCADRAMVMSHGRKVLEGTASDISADPDALERAYFGEATT